MVTVEAYHTGAGFADPVFVPILTKEYQRTRSFLNGTHLQFDVADFSFAAKGFPSDSNYARWEPVTIESGFGDGIWVVDGEGFLAIAQDEHEGWIVCEWYHEVNAPQLF
ncbi:hypothetical protein GLAREA_08635 [Glarea lozoyensis ATCC 20868]|uniref:DUF7907 domain-containing protein n=1 Tax=Glarea lozoyensis (strain ATCC 20868 / MF5171) TaxID=1116229 RepID=S3CE97_GLAL2|nr:uncharacterized protein GLAREA_08635 [Glarea lozoyensis ATCC 20868]EPE24782.1 hypothetical protein GLAREA_08635 [Glarea lozoyensis ATCC 20868]